MPGRTETRLSSEVQSESAIGHMGSDRWPAGTGIMVADMSSRNRLRNVRFEVVIYVKLSAHACKFAMAIGDFIRGR